MKTSDLVLLVQQRLKSSLYLDNVQIFPCLANHRFKKLCFQAPLPRCFQVINQNFRIPLKFGSGRCNQSFPIKCNRLHTDYVTDPKKTLIKLRNGMRNVKSIKEASICCCFSRKIPRAKIAHLSWIQRFINTHL